MSLYIGLILEAHDANQCGIPFQVRMVARNLRATVKHEADELFGLWLETGQVAPVFEGWRTSFDRFGDACICLQNDLPREQHRLFQRMIKLPKPIVNLWIGIAWG